MPPSLAWRDIPVLIQSQYFPVSKLQEALFCYDLSSERSLHSHCTQRALRCAWLFAFLCVMAARVLEIPWIFYPPYHNWHSQWWLSNDGSWTYQMDTAYKEMWNTCWNLYDASWGQGSLRACLTVAATRVKSDANVLHGRAHSDASVILAGSLRIMVCTCDVHVSMSMIETVHLSLCLFELREHTGYATCRDKIRACIQHAFWVIGFQSFWCWPVLSPMCFIWTFSRKQVCSSKWKTTLALARWACHF